MLTTNLSVQSTLLEGFTGNGSLAFASHFPFYWLWCSCTHCWLRYRAAEGYNFDQSDISHSHGWATGPTSALTFHVLGITLTSPLGRAWRIAPVLSGLLQAEGGFETRLGWFGVKWNIEKNRLTVEISTPNMTSGVVVLPGAGPIDSEVSGRIMSIGDDGSVAVHGGEHVLTRNLS
jgi:hypothetical protein